MSFFRPELDLIPPYVPGKPATDPDIIKLSSNEIPEGPLPGVTEAVADAIANVNRYPDMSGSLLIADIAAFHDIDPNRVVISNGSVAMIEKIMSAVCKPGSEVVCSAISFEAYPIMITAAGGQRVAVPTLADGAHDIDAMIAAITDNTAAVILCSPNNPTGHGLRHGDVVKVLESTDTLVILDEAYIDFVTMEDPIRAAELLDYPHLVILRTFSKAYGLAGIRLGYAIASEPVASMLRTISTPFGVSTAAQAAGRAALAARDVVRERVEKIIAERTRVQAAIAELGLEVPDSQANFVWVSQDPARFAQICADHKIIVRAFGDGVRVTIAETEGNDRLIAAVAEFMK